MKINGSLVFDASSASEIQNLRIQKVGSNPTFVAADAGRLVFNTGNGTLYIGVGAPTSNWVAIATGGDAAALSARVDALIASLDVTDNAGAFDGTSLNALANVTGATSLLEVLQDLDAAITAAAGVDTLGELSDVTLGTPATGEFLRYNGTVWADHLPVLADISDVTVPAADLNLLSGLTATAAELNILDGVTGTSAADISSIAGFAAEDVSAAEFGHLDGVTSSIQGQLDSKQAGDADLTAISALAGTGIAVRTAADTWALRTLEAPAAGFSITNPAGVGGNPTFALANDLAALEDLTTTGYVVRTADGAAATRAIVGTAGNIVVTNGDGVSSDTSLNLGTVSQAASGDFVKVTLDTFGRVTGNTPVVAADITALVDAEYVNVSGDTMTGNLNFGGTFTATSLAAPVNANDAATKAYVDALSSGLSWKQAVRVATTGNVSLAPAPATIDGITLASGDRVLVKSQTAAAENGIYTFNGTDLVRSADMDVAGEFDGATVFVTEGTAHADSGWTQTAEVATLGTTAVVWQQFSGSTTYDWGVGLFATGNVIDIRLGSGIFEGPTDAVGIDLFDTTTGALILTTDGTTRESPLSLNGQLHLLLQAAGGLAQAADGLRINAGGVTNAMLVNQGVVTNADSGTNGTLNLGGELEIAGTSTQGITTAIAGSVFTISALDASSAQKGVASFDATEFAVTAGNVVLGTVPVSKLSANTINFVGTDAIGDTVTLGETVTFVDGGHADQAPMTFVAVDTNSIEITLREATTTALGVASFNTDHFSVTEGAVSLAATLSDLTNVAAGVDGAADGSLLQKAGTEWVAVTVDSITAGVDLTDLADVSSSHVEGHVLVSASGQWVNKKIYHLHAEDVAATSWTVTHNLGQKYCNVTIVDDTDEVVIPQSITFGTANQLTVTFNTAVAGKAIVMGLNVGA